MAAKSFESYFKAFQMEYENVVGDMKPCNAFTIFCAKYFYYAESQEDIDEDFVKCMPDGSNDGGFDIVFPNPTDDSNELVIMQGKYYKKSKLTPQDFKNELSKIIDTLRALSEHKVGKLNDAVKAAHAAAVNDLEDGYRVRIDFCTLYKPTPPQLKAFHKIAAEKAAESKFQIRFLSHDDIYRQVVSCETAADTVAEHTLVIDKADNILRYDRSAIVNVSAQSLQKMFQLYKNRVLGRNLRYHIKSNAQAKDVDREIARTIRDEPENFWYLNNGILIACEDYALTGTELKLKKFSIVNGGQTTFNIANAPDLSQDFFVQCKVIVSSGSDEKSKAEFCLKIAKATNSQKPIKMADLRANEPEQLHLKKLLAAQGFHYVTKAGDKPERKAFKNYQIANLDKVGKAALAGLLLMPGTSRSSPSKMFDEGIYNEIFLKPFPAAITDILTLSYYFKTFQRKAIANPDEFGLDDEDRLPAVKNGEKYFLACIGFLAKIRAKVFTHQDVKKEKSKGDDALRCLLWKSGGLERIVTATGDVYPLAEKVFLLLTKKVIAPCCKQERKTAEKTGCDFVLANYLKKDSTFTNDIMGELWSQYTDEDSSLKSAIESLMG